MIIKTNRNRKKQHREYVFETIRSLRQEIIDAVLEHAQKGEGKSFESIVHKGVLAKKYTRRLKLIEFKA